MVKRKRFFIYICLFLSIFILISIFLFIIYKSFLFQEKARRLLPKSSKDVREFNWSNPGFLPDYWYALKAKMTSDEFETYRKKMGFISVPKDKWEDSNNWSGMSGIESWWDPNGDSEVLYYNPNLSGSTKAIMKFENGYLYYKETFGF